MTGINELDEKFLGDYLKVIGLRFKGETRIDVDTLSSHVNWSNIDKFSQYLIDNGIPNYVDLVYSPFQGNDSDPYIVLEESDFIND